MFTQSKFSLEKEELTLRGEMAPGHFFFCRRVELPSDLEPDDEAEVVSLELEGMAPFPLEHMNFGYRIDEARKFAFVYASYKKRFPDGTSKKWSELDGVLPDFALALLKGEKGGTPLATISEEAVSYFEFDDASELPCGFFSKAIEKDEDGVSKDEDSQMAALKAVSEKANTASEIRVWNLDTPIFVEGDDLSLRGIGDAGGPMKAVVLRDELWAMDLRDEEVVDGAKASYKRNIVLWRVVVGMAALFALLILGELAWVGTSSYSGLRNGWNRDQQPRVDAIDSQRSTINELLNFQESNLAPFSVLVSIDKYRYRNSSPSDENFQIRYTKVETDGANGLVLDAECRQSSFATEFRDRLNRDEQIESVNLERVRSDPSGTKFTAILKFRPGAFAEEGPTNVASND